MSNLPDPLPTAATTRAEKLRAIAAVFGESMAARLDPGRVPPPAGPPDPARLAWQTNRLIRHLRDRVDPGQVRPGAGTSTDATAGAQARPPDPAPPMGHGAATLPRPLPFLVAGEDLAAEHPAVIARILRTEPQDIRVSVLRALPGPVARAVIRRLRPPAQPRRD